MRKQLHLFKKTLALHWGYSSLSTLDKTQSYVQTLASIGKGYMKHTTSSYDVRNLSLKQVFFKPRLTPLASTEKKTFSGFDLRLAQLKGPKVLKRTRRAFVLTYGRAISPSGAVTQTLPTPYTGSGLGWGRKSSRALSFLTSRPVKTFHKPLKRGLLEKTHCYPGPLLAQLSVIATAEPAYLTALDNTGNYVLSSELYCPTPLNIEADIFNPLGENPNLSSVGGASQQLPATAFNEALKSHIKWVTAIGPTSLKYLNAWPLLKTRSSLMRRALVTF